MAAKKAAAAPKADTTETPEAPAKATSSNPGEMSTGVREPSTETLTNDTIREDF